MKNKDLKMHMIESKCKMSEPQIQMSPIINPFPPEVVELYKHQNIILNNVLKALDNWAEKSIEAIKKQ